MNTTSTPMQDQAASRTQESTQGPALVDFNTPHEYVDIGHSRLAYWGVGDGPDLVLVHGWPLHSATFRRLLPKLSQHYRCHLFDLPGAGKTESEPDAPFGIKAHGESLYKAIRSKGLRRYALLGHDSGAAIMQFTAAQDKEHVVALIMGNTETPGYHSLTMKAFLTLAKLPGGPSALFKMLRFKPFRHSSMGLGSAFKDPAYMEGDFFEWFIAPLTQSAEIRERQARLLKYFDPDDVDDLITIQKDTSIPVQLLWGDKDQFFLLSDAKKMQQRFQGPSELHVFEGGKLFIHEDFADAFAERVLLFLGRHHLV